MEGSMWGDYLRDPETFIKIRKESNIIGETLNNIKDKISNIYSKLNQEEKYLFNEVVRECLKEFKNKIIDLENETKKVKKEKEIKSEKNDVINYKGLELIPIRELKEKKTIHDFKYNLVWNDIFEITDYNHKEFYDVVKSVENTDKELEFIDIFKINNNNVLNSLVVIPTDKEFMFYIENEEELRLIKNIKEILNKNIKENSIKNDYLIVHKKSNVFEEEAIINFKSKTIEFYLDEVLFLTKHYETNLEANKDINKIEEIFEKEKILFIKNKMKELKL